jgi:predicted kinase
MTLRTYHQLFTLAGSLLERGENVIIDASMGRVAWRQAAAEIAREHFADLIELRCVLPTAVAERRLIERMVAGTDASDADVDIASRMASDFDEWPEAIVVDTFPLADEVVRTTINDLVPSSTIASIGSKVASNSAAPPSAR